ncbi:hypothetical protein DWV00_14740, partial [Trinickia dinghuensis]
SAQSFFDMPGCICTFPEPVGNAGTLKLLVGFEFLPLLLVLCALAALDAKPLESEIVNSAAIANGANWR